MKWLAVILGTVIAVSQAVGPANLAAVGNVEEESSASVVSVNNVIYLCVRLQIQYAKESDVSSLVSLPLPFSKYCFSSSYEISILLCFTMLQFRIYSCKPGS